MSDAVRYRRGCCVDGRRGFIDWSIVKVCSRDMPERNHDSQGFAIYI